MKQKKRLMPRWVEFWNKALWDAMGKTGKGYRQGSFKFQQGDERRADKREGLGSNKHMRGYNARYT